jgi:hypothetical protein
MDCQGEKHGMKTQIKKLYCQRDKLTGEQNVAVRSVTCTG